MKMRHGLLCVQLVSLILALSSYGGIYSDAALSDSMDGWQGVGSGGPVAVSLDGTDKIAGNYSVKVSGKVSGEGNTFISLMKTLPQGAQFSQYSLESFNMNFKVLTTDTEWALRIYFWANDGSCVMSKDIWNLSGNYPVYWTTGLTKSDITSWRSDKTVTCIEIVAEFLTDDNPVICMDNLNIKVLSDPTFTPDGGFYSGSVAVTIDCAEAGATIRYTTDGSDPSETNGTAISPGTVVTVTPPMTLKAKAWSEGSLFSGIKSAEYTLGYGDAALSDSMDGWQGVGSGGPVAVSLDDTDKIAGSYSVKVSGKVSGEGNTFISLMKTLPQGAQFSQYSLESFNMNFKVLTTDTEWALRIYFWANDGSCVMSKDIWNLSGNYTVYWTNGLTKSDITSWRSDKTVTCIEIVAEFLTDDNPVICMDNLNIKDMFSRLISGDANSDGSVDVGDLGILAANYGTVSGATWSQGDFNGDGAVDVGDLGILAANYGSSSSSYEADYEKVFGTSCDEADSEEAGSSDDDSESTFCSSLGLSLIAGLAMLGLMIVKMEE